MRAKCLEIRAISRAGDPELKKRIKEQIPEEDRRKMAREARESETDRCAEPIGGNHAAKRPNFCLLVFGEIHMVGSSIPRGVRRNAKRSGLMLSRAFLSSSILGLTLLLAILVCTHAS